MIVFVAATFIPFIPAVTMSDSSGFGVSVPTNSFGIYYTHSANKSPIEEHYFVKGDKIVQDDFIYSTYGAGVPSEVPDGMNLEILPDKMILTGYTTQYLQINLITSDIADTKIELGNKMFRMIDFVPNMTKIKIFPDTMSVFNIIFNVY